uniref:Uncharacterized protein n=1 Tax=Meloidogyne enterolobii TaxID=390850 RepID=A0A6V7W9B7_MELEN|nr:unnamed protein product [Meloidogyne enterolobii]
MEASKQNMNQYFIHHQTHATYSPIINNPINIQQYFQPFCLPNYSGYPYAFPQQMIYYPYSFMPPQSIHPIEQNSTFISENTSLATIEKLLLDTIPDLDGTEGSFEIQKFFKKFKVATEDWSDKKRIKALKSKLSNRAIHAFEKAIANEHSTYSSISQNILSLLIPNEYRDKGHQNNHHGKKIIKEETKNLKEITKEKKILRECHNSPQKKKNLKEHEKIFKNQNIPSFKNKVNIKFEKEEFSKEILEFFDMPINQDSAKEEIEIEKLENEKLLENLGNLGPIIENDLIFEKELNVESLEDSRKEEFCELDEELICSLDGKQDLVSVEIPIPTEIHVFQEIFPLDIPVSHEESVCSEEKECEESEELEVIREEGSEEYVDLEEKESEECLELKEKGSDVSVDLKEKVCEVCDDLKEFGKEDCVDLEEKGSDECVNLKVLGEGGKKRDDLEEISEEKVDEKGILESKLEVFEKDPEKEILPTRDKLEVLKRNENFDEKRNGLRSKLKEAKILRKLRCQDLRKEILSNGLGKDFECESMKRKITGRFFLEVRKCLNFEKLVTMIRVPKLSKNLLKEMNRIISDLKPMNVLQIISVIKQDVMLLSRDAGIEKDWKKRKRKQEKGLVESVSVTEFLTIGVLLETFHRRSGLVNRDDLENPMINFDTESKKEQPRHPRPFRKTGRDGRTYSDVEDAVI